MVFFFIQRKEEKNQQSFRHKSQQRIKWDRTLKKNMTPMMLVKKGKGKKMYHDGYNKLNQVAPQQSFDIRHEFLINKLDFFVPAHIL